MAVVFKKNEIEFREDIKKIDNYRLFTASPRLAVVAESKNLIFDMRLLNPDQFSFPYHFHRNAEELIVIMSGTLTLRSPKGLETVNEGDIIFFEMGETGAHQFYNHSSEPCKYLDIRTLYGIDVVEYPDSGKLNIIPAYEIFEKDSKVNYFKGEDNPLGKLAELKREIK